MGGTKCHPRSVNINKVQQQQQQEQVQQRQQIQNAKYKQQTRQQVKQIWPICFRSPSCAHSTKVTSTNFFGQVIKFCWIFFLCSEYFLSLSLSFSPFVSLSRLNIWAIWRNPCKLFALKVLGQHKQRTLIVRPFGSRQRSLAAAP